MRDGGSKDDSDGLRAEGAGGTGSGGTGSGGRWRGLRDHRLAVPAVALVVLVAAGVAIPLVLAGSDDTSAQACWHLTSSDRALADDPRAATKALDPGDDLARLGSARKLLRHESVCGDGVQVLGRIVDAATRSAGPGRPHTLAQARTAYAVTAAVHDLKLPEGLAPGLARMVAEYVVDAGKDKGWGINDLPGPAVTPEEARPDAEGWSVFGRFLAPDEAHSVFGYADSSLGADADMESLVAELSKDPEAFAILYDAERADLAHYLERLTDDGGDPGFRPPSRPDSLSTPTAGSDNDLQDVAGRIGTLMNHRAGYARDRTIADLAEFDRTVRRNTRGTFRPAENQLDSRPVMGDIADRPAAGPVHGDLMDGRHQVFTVLDAWAKDRGVPAGRAAAIKQLMDDAYVRALWLRF
ncbi:hypothetical protein ACFWFI_06215 [Streptomyces sp. NPDC060209]|uniref:hypothetical protein n=1 Tax=Streptomyces sp. NPDC060209 TaxID=3347073 RepID=UPI00365BCFDF